MYERTELLIGKDNLDKINNTKILVIGVGGVGGTLVEALVRSGIKDITLVDYDKVDISNINRQIIATTGNIDKYKVDLWEERIKDINSDIRVNNIKEKITEDNINILFNNKYDYIIDACDTIIVKKSLIKICHEKNIKLLTICGMGKRLDPSKVLIGDIRDTSYDAIAKILRKYIKDEKIKGKVPCIYSKEVPIKINTKTIPSMMLVPSSAGLLAASYIIQSIIKEN